MVLQYKMSFSEGKVEEYYLNNDFMVLNETTSEMVKTTAIQGRYAFSILIKLNNVLEYQAITSKL